MKALKTLSIFPTTYFAEKAFSTLVDIKTKKRNSLMDTTLDALMRGALETKINPDFRKIAEAIQQQASH